MSRVYGEPTAIDAEQVRAFFERRGRNVRAEAPLTAVLYQDDHPELAVARDRAEKQRILPLLGVNENTSVLDIGCGVGRWADDLPDVACYCGVDPIESLLEVARQRLADRRNVQFLPLGAEDIAPDRLPRSEGYDLLIIAGVLIYLNDDQAERALAAAASCAAPGATLYIREPTGIGQRLTLNGHWSQELGSVYNAVYRTREELCEMFERQLAPAGFGLAMDDDLYPADLNNRAETRQRFYLLKRD